MASQFHIPTLVVGDFNCQLESLPCWEVASRRGFQDIAVVQAHCHDTVPDLTYRGISRLDYVVANPLAFRAFQNLHVDPMGYADHALSTATFSWPMKFPPVLHYPLPFDFDTLGPLPELHGYNVPPEMHASFMEAIQRGDNDTALNFFVKAFETKVQYAYQSRTSLPMQQAFLGRCNIHPTNRRVARISVSKHAGIATDWKVLGLRIKCFNWIRELSFSIDRGKDLAKHLILWDRVLNADGFAPSFPEWALQQDWVEFCPIGLPDLQWIQAVRDGMAQELRFNKQMVALQRSRAFAERYRDDWLRGGRLHAACIKPDNFGTLHSLHVSFVLKARLMRTVKGSYAKLKLLAGAPDNLVGATLLAGEQSWTICDVSQDGIITLDKPVSTELLKRSFQCKQWCSDPHAVAREVQSFWNGFWNSPRKPNFQVMESLVASLPQLPVFDGQITYQEIAEAIATMPNGKARGLDGFSIVELKMMSDEDHIMLAHLFNSFTETGKWPRPLLKAYVALLNKQPMPETPKDTRPITVLPTLFRLWSRIHAKKVFRAIVDLLPNELYGFVPGKGTLDAAMELQSMLEEAMNSGATVCGVSIDLSKCYNTIPREFVLLLAQRLGWPKRLVLSYLAYHDGLERSFRFHDGMFAPTTSKIGVPEGDPLAVPIMIMVTWATTVSVHNEGVTCRATLTTGFCLLLNHSHCNHYWML